MTTTKATNQKTAPKTTTQSKATRAKKGTNAQVDLSTTVIPDIEAADPVEEASVIRVLATVQQDVFTKAIETAIGVIPMKQGHTAALLDRLRLTTDPAKQTLKVTGFNLVVGIEVSLSANVEGSGDWTVSANKLFKAHAKLSLWSCHTCNGHPLKQCLLSAVPQAHST